MKHSLALAVALLWVGVARADPWPSIPIPPNNAATLSSAPDRPPPGDASTRAEHLAQALAGGDIDAAMDFFLPREPFLAIKDMSAAAGYFASLVRWYRQDIAAYRAQIPSGVPVRFVRFEPSRHCAWMGVGHEANRLPYWSCYRSRLVLDVGGRETVFRVQVMIHWGDQWFVTHLGPIRTSSHH